MTDRESSPTDKALRERLTELCVHIPCGDLRGPLQKRSRFYPESRVRWQSCQDEDAPEKWDNKDVSRQFELCIVCFRATAGGTSRWSWLACQGCRAINESLGQRWGFRPFALGRHSIMNGIAVQGGSSPEVQAAQMERLIEFGKGDHDLRDWRRREYTRLASKFGPLADVPLKTWQHEWTPGKEASQDAFARLLGD